MVIAFSEFSPQLHSFFCRLAEVVGPELVGCRLVKRQEDGSLLWGVIVETEAYSHRCGWNRTPGPVLRTRPTWPQGPNWSAAKTPWGAHLVVKVKEPQVEEFPFLRADQVLFTYMHLAAYPAVGQALIEAGTNALPDTPSHHPWGRLKK